MSSLYEYMWFPDLLDSATYVLSNTSARISLIFSSFDYLVTYIRLHLEIFSFLQRVGLNPTDTILPTLEFFVPGTSISPLPIPPLPSSFTFGSAITWLGTCAVGLAPFAGFYLWKRYSIQLTDILKYKYHSVIPAPVNRRKWFRQPLGDVTSQYYPEGGGPPPGATENGLPEDGTFGNGSGSALDSHTEAAAFPVGTVQPRRQSTVSGTARPPGSAEDEFGSDDDGENEMVRAAIISIEVGPAEPANGAPGNNATGDVLGEIRPHMENKPDTPHEPVYRENTFTLLPSFFAASILGLSTFRIISTPWEAFTLSSIAGLYAARGHGPMGRLPGGEVWGLMNGLGVRGLFTPWRRWESTLALEMILFNGVGWAGLGLSWILMRSKMSDEEWEEREKKEKEEKRLEEARVQEEQRQQQEQGQAQEHPPQQEGHTTGAP